MTITTNSVFKNTVTELSDYISSDELRELLVKLYEANGIKGLTDFENNVTILTDTGNHPATLDYIEDLMENYLEG